MAYIWENYLSTRKYCLGREISPYMEMLTESEKVCQVNPLIRFAEIFSGRESLWDNGEEEDDRGLREIISENFESGEFENVLFHYLALLDLLKGIDEKQIKADHLEEEIKQGDFGMDVGKKWDGLKVKDRNVILYALLEKLQSETADNCFFKAVQKLFAETSMIYEKSTDRYYCYICEQETDYNKLLMDIVTFLLWNIQCKLQIVWKYHYGIIGNDDTMKVSGIQIAGFQSVFEKERL